MQRPRPRRTDERDRPDDEVERPDVGEPRGFRPPKWLIGVALIALGVVFIILDDTIWATKSTGGSGAGGGYVVHGPVATHVLAVDGVRARPILLLTKGAPLSRVDVAISFDNGASVTRLVAPRDLLLLASGRTLSGANSGAYALRPTRLSPGAHITGTLRFAGHLTPGLTLVFIPSWDAGHPLRWLLWH